MTNENFELKLLDTHWIKETDDPNDLCAHGHVFVKIGTEVISDGKILDVCIKCGFFAFNAYDRNRFIKRTILRVNCYHTVVILSFPTKVKPSQLLSDVRAV